MINSRSASYAKQQKAYRSEHILLVLSYDDFLSFAYSARIIKRKVETKNCRRIFLPAISCNNYGKTMHTEF